MAKISIAELNKKYEGTFRELTQSEITKFQKKLNINDENEWYEPYAVRSINGVERDIVCLHDTPRSTLNALFVAIK